MKKNKKWVKREKRFPRQANAFRGEVYFRQKFWPDPKPLGQGTGEGRQGGGGVFRLLTPTGTRKKGKLNWGKGEKKAPLLGGTVKKKDCQKRQSPFW